MFLDSTRLSLTLYWPEQCKGAVFSSFGLRVWECGQTKMIREIVGQHTHTVRV